MKVDNSLPTLGELGGGLSNRKVRWLAPIAIAGLFVIWGSWFIYRTSFLINGSRYFSLFDDAMISMRYAWNLTQGNGLVWNAGEYVEGYTNLLMTLIMAIPNAFLDKAAAVLSVQILGIILMLIIALLSLGIGNRVLRQDMDAYKNLTYALITLGVLSYYPLVYWTLTGMETGLLTMLLLASILLTLRYIDERRKSQLYLSATTLGLAFLTRNDAVIFAIVIFAYLLYMTVRSKGQNSDIKPILFAGTIFALFVILQLAFRYSYYGHLLPNTYLLKVSGFPIELRIKNGLRFIAPFTLETFLLLLLACLSLVTKFCSRRLFLLSIFAAASLYQVWNGGDPWPYWRMIVPSMPLIITLAMITVIELGASLRGKKMTAKTEFSDGIDQKAFSPWRAALIVIIALLILIPANLRFGKQIFGRIKPYTVEANESNVRKALALIDLTTEEATIGVFWAGSIPYYSERKAIDFLGKSDEYIASLPPDLSEASGSSRLLFIPGHNKYDLTYSIQELKPTFIQNVRWKRQDLSQWAETNYEEVTHNGVRLFLLADSEQVKWQK